MSILSWTQSFKTPVVWFDIFLSWLWKVHQFIWLLSGLLPVWKKIYSYLKAARLKCPFYFWIHFQFGLDNHAFFVYQIKKKEGKINFNQCIDLVCFDKDNSISKSFTADFANMIITVLINVLFSLKYCGLICLPGACSVGHQLWSDSKFCQPIIFYLKWRIFLFVQ